MTAHQQLRRANPAKGYVAGRCNASTVAVTSDLGARPDKARLLHPPLWDLSFQSFTDRRDASPMPPPGGRGPHPILQTNFDNRLESHRNPAIHPKFEFQDGLSILCRELLTVNPKLTQFRRVRLERLGDL
jgi:hypothetical protein